MRAHVRCAVVRANVRCASLCIGGGGEQKHFLLKMKGAGHRIAFLSTHLPNRQSYLTKFEDPALISRIRFLWASMETKDVSFLVFSSNPGLEGRGDELACFEVQFYFCLTNSRIEPIKAFIYLFIYFSNLQIHR